MAASTTKPASQLRAPCNLTLTPLAIRQGRRMALAQRRSLSNLVELLIHEAARNCPRRQP